MDRHAAGADRNRVALRWLDAEGRRHDFTYGRLAELTNRFANVLRRLGVNRGDCVFAVTERTPELFITALGTLKHRSVFCPIYPAYGPEPLRTRLALGRGKLLVTTAGIYRRKLASVVSELPELKHVLLVGDSEQPPVPPGTGDFHELVQAAEEGYSIPPTDGEDPALLHFTSGTTGTPKGALHVHESVIAHHESARLALDLGPGDVFFMIANYADMDVKPGSMGRPLPGIDAAINRRLDESLAVIDEPDTVGELALRTPWPSMFRGYLAAAARYRQCFVDG